MNLREIRHLSEWTANGLGLLANTLIITMTLTERNQTLRFYSRMIVASSIVDFIYIFGSMLCTESAIIEGGSILFISDGFFSRLPIQGVQYWMAGVYVFILAIGNYIVPIEYYYRWHLVVRGQALSAKKFALILLIAGSSAAIGGFQFIYFLFVRPEEETVRKFGHLLNNPMWLSPNGELPKFVANSLENLYFFGQLVGVGLLAICSYGIAIILGLKTYEKLQSMKHIMSARTIRLQRSMTLILVIKAIAPFCLCTFPVCAAFIGVVFRISIPNLGLFLVIATSFIPLVSPFSTLILLPGYRRRLVDKFLEMIGKKQTKTHLITISTTNFMPKITRRPSFLYSVYSN